MPKGFDYCNDSVIPKSLQLIAGARGSAVNGGLTAMDEVLVSISLKTPERRI